MNGRNRTVAVLAFAGVLTASQALLAQGPSAWGPQDRYDERTWNAPRGYNDYYHENGNPNMAARQGYAAGFAQGESDFREHHSFRPTHVDTYKHVPESPQGFNRDDFKRTYRESFERGYSKGYGR